MNYTLRAIQDGVLVHDPVFVRCVILTSDGIGATSVTLHNGLDVSSPVVATVRAPADTTVAIRYPDPLGVTDGLFVNVGSNFAEALIGLFEPE